MTESTRTFTIPESRVVTRRRVSGAAARRRRLFQNHLLLYLFFNLGALGLDAVVVAPPGLQWAWWLSVPWTLVFAIHLLGLKGRGYTFAELFIPPKTEKIEEEYPEPLHYELVRARQLRDGIESAADAVARSHPEAARRALEAADALVKALEGTAAAVIQQQIRDGDERVQQLVAEARSAIRALDDLHEGLIAVDVLDEPVDGLPVEEVRRRGEALARTSSGA